MALAAVLVCKFVSWAQDLVRTLEYNDPIAIRASRGVLPWGWSVVAYHTD